MLPANGEIVQCVDIKEEYRISVAVDFGLKHRMMAMRLHRAYAATGDRVLGHCGVFSNTVLAIVPVHRLVASIPMMQPIVLMEMIPPDDISL